MDKKCSIQFPGDAIPQVGFGIGLNKGSIWKTKINELLIKYDEDSILKGLETKWLSNGCIRNPHNDLNELGINTFGFVFTVLIIWIVFSFFITILERTYEKKFNNDMHDSYVGQST